MGRLTREELFSLADKRREHGDGDFDSRYRRLLGSRLTQWGRTTCFDLLLRAGALGVGGERYLPELAYLASSTGPRKGFAIVFGVAPDRGTERWAEEGQQR
jgi:hypothetical protein